MIEGLLAIAVVAAWIGFIRLYKWGRVTNAVPIAVVDAIRFGEGWSYKPSRYLTIHGQKVRLHGRDPCREVLFVEPIE